MTETTDDTSQTNAPAGIVVRDACSARLFATDMENRNDRIEGDGSSPVPCSALAGSFDIEAIELAFFNHDGEGAEPAPGQWEERRDQWRSFKAYLAAHPRQEVSGCDAYREDLPPAKNL